MIDPAAERLSFSPWFAMAVFALAIFAVVMLWLWWWMQGFSTLVTR